MKKKQQLITLQQLEHWLIYHCPLQDTSKSLFYKGTRVAKRVPFSVTFADAQIGCSYTAVENNPWDCYDTLSELLYRDFDALSVITDLYYKS